MLSAWTVVVDFAQHNAVAVVTMLVEIPRTGKPASGTYVTFPVSIVRTAQ